MRVTSRVLAGLSVFWVFTFQMSAPLFAEDVKVNSSNILSIIQTKEEYREFLYEVYEQTGSIESLVHTLVNDHDFRCFEQMNGEHHTHVYNCNLLVCGNSKYNRLGATNFGLNYTDDRYIIDKSDIIESHSFLITRYQFPFFRCRDVNNDNMNQPRTPGSHSDFYYREIVRGEQ